MFENKSSQSKTTFLHTMKKQTINLPQLPLFQSFGTRMLNFTISFISLLFSSKAPFYDPDSIIFISEGSYLYSESENGIYCLPGKQYISEKQEYKSRRKAFFTSNLSSAGQDTDYKTAPLFFILPQSSHYIGNAENSLSTAVLGNSFPFKKHHQITGPIFRSFLKNFTLKKKLQDVNKESINLLKITVSHFSRPPPRI